MLVLTQHHYRSQTMGLIEDAPENTANESIVVGEKVGKKNLRVPFTRF